MKIAKRAFLISGGLILISALEAGTIAAWVGGVFIAIGVVLSAIDRNRDSLSIKI